MPTVALCEDDAALRSVLARAIRGAGHNLVTARNGAEAIRDFPAARPDVAVLDIGLPDADGRDVCLALRAGGLKARVLFLTALDGVHNKIVGFESGADDYLTKPFDLDELLVRIVALSRRESHHDHDSARLRLDPAAHAIIHEGEQISLTPTEFRVLARLLSSPGHVVRRHALVAAGWPTGAIVHDNTLDSYIRRIRSKLLGLDGLTASVATVRGVGYSWR